jgi:outer membrane biosynthesis protein TonB
MQSASFQLTRPKRPLAGWAWVLVLHALLFWAVHVGLTRDVVQKMPTVVQALLLSETRPATPPPAAPPPPTPSPPPPTPQPVKPAQTPAPVAPPVAPAPAAELPAISTPAPTPTGLTASAPAAPPAPPAAPPVATPVTASTNAKSRSIRVRPAVLKKRALWHCASWWVWMAKCFNPRSKKALASSGSMKPPDWVCPNANSVPLCSMANPSKPGPA